MRLVAGERDNLIMNTVPRFQPANDRVLLLAATAQSFKVPATGVASPAAITFTAALLNMVGVVDISTSDGSVLELDGNVATLRYAAMASNTTTITARIVVDGLTYANDGDWVESLTALVEHADGRLEIIDWAEAMRRRTRRSPMAALPQPAGA